MKHLTPPHPEPECAVTIDNLLSRILELEAELNADKQTIRNLQEKCDRAVRHAVAAEAEAQRAKNHASQLAWATRKLGLALKKQWKKDLVRSVVGKQTLSFYVPAEVVEKWGEEMRIWEAKPLGSEFHGTTEEDWRAADGDAWLRSLGCNL